MFSSYSESFRQTLTLRDFASRHIHIICRSKSGSSITLDLVFLNVRRGSKDTHNRLIVLINTLYLLLGKYEALHNGIALLQEDVFGWNTDNTSVLPSDCMDESHKFVVKGVVGPIESETVSYLPPGVAYMYIEDNTPFTDDETLGVGGYLSALNSSLIECIDGTKMFNIQYPSSYASRQVLEVSFRYEEVLDDYVLKLLSLPIDNLETGDVSACHDLDVVSTLCTTFTTRAESVSWRTFPLSKAFNITHEGVIGTTDLYPALFDYVDIKQFTKRRHKKIEKKGNIMRKRERFLYSILFRLRMQSLNDNVVIEKEHLLSVCELLNTHRDNVMKVFGLRDRSKKRLTLLNIVHLLNKIFKKVGINKLERKNTSNRSLGNHTIWTYINTLRKRP